ncbi:MAG TPA: glycosyl hydrolase family 8, partial [Patescibacteria group bacterium]|nr:glycosyl hydrolase family 8 [Patescibacteria group bacterium]
IQIIYPLWHRAVYGIEAWSTRIVYGWAHLYAIFDGITKDAMSWQPTGAKTKADPKYFRFRVLQIVFNLIPSILWVYLAARQVIVYKNLVFIPILLSGIYYYLICAKISFFVSNNKFRFTDLFSKNVRLATNQIIITMPLIILVCLNILLLNHKALNLNLPTFQKHEVAKETNRKSETKQAYAKILIQTSFDKETLAKTWVYYKAHFMTMEGQSIDPERVYKTTSEGQSYLMLRSVIIDDRDTFDKAWTWTKDNIQHKDDKLFAWLWGGKTKASEKIISQDNATDADEDIALSLILASYKWNNKQYLIDAKEIIKDLWKNDVKELGGRYYLLAGSQFNKPNGLVINPSYLSPASYRIFGKVDKDNNWNKLADDSYLTLIQINSDTKDTVGLPPNWVLAARTGKIVNASQYVSGDSGIYGYDSFRTFWRVALDNIWFGDKKSKDYLSVASPFFEYEWKTSIKINATYSTDGIALSKNDSPSVYAAPLATFMITDKNLAEDIYKNYYQKQLDNGGYWGTGKSYYDQNWSWFATALYSGNLKLPGQLN